MIGHHFRLWGHPTKVLLEVDLPNGTSIRVPISDVTEYIQHDLYGEIRIPIRGLALEKIMDAIDESEFRRG